MTSTATITPIGRSRIERGKRAWGKLQTTAAEQRAWWIEVGEALIDLKDKANRPGLKFSEAVGQEFPGLTDAHDIADAQWLAGNSVTVTETDLAHPSRIRRWFNEHQAEAALPEPLKEVKVTRHVAIEPRLGERGAKTVKRWESKGEGSENADRMSQSVAGQLGSTVQAHYAAAKERAP